MLAFICPGQGSQSVGMAHDIYEQYPAAREMLDSLAAAADFPLLQTMFEGPDELLTATENAQPALVAHSLAVAAILQEHGIKPDMAAGHSLGEYSALAIAGAIAPAEAVKLVRLRGELMAEAGAETGGAMAAIIGLDEQKVLEAIHLLVSGLFAIDSDSVGADYLAQFLPVSIANYNSESQIVITGEDEAVAAVSEVALELGAKRAIPLQVSGAFHSRLMKPAADRLATILETVELCDAAIPVVTNVDAAAQTEAAKLKQGLVRQLTEPVLWKQSVACMVQAGADSFVEVGAGQVLAKMLQRSGMDAVILNTGTAAAVGETINQLT